MCVLQIEKEVENEQLVCQVLVTLVIKNNRSGKQQWLPQRGSRLLCHPILRFSV